MTLDLKLGFSTLIRQLEVKRDRQEAALNVTNTQLEYLKKKELESK